MTPGNKSILVSICCITYNHERFIRQCLDGFLMQKTGFEFEILIHDDASTDGTAHIIREYEQKYPDIIKPIYQNENQYSKGIPISITYNFPRAKGKYIALCEGDDYWTDPCKLQKQVDFLEHNPEYSICCHRYRVYDEDTGEWHSDYASPYFSQDMDNIVFDNEFNHTKCWFTKTLTILFRKDAHKREDFSHYKHTKDSHLFYHLLQNRKGCCFNFDAAVYRCHSGGVWSAANQKQQIATNYLVYKELYIYNRRDIVMRKMLQSYFSLHYTHNIKPVLLEKKITRSNVGKILFFYLDDMRFFRSKLIRSQIKRRIMSF